VRTYAVAANDGRNYATVNVHVPHTGSPTTKDDYYYESRTSVDVEHTIFFLLDVFWDVQRKADAVLHWTCLGFTGRFQLG